METAFDAGTIGAALHARGQHDIAGRVRFFARVGSTNDEGKAQLEQGAPAWTVLVADVQTAGRGRRGRQWETPPGAALLCSVLLRPSIPPQSLNRLTMLGAVAVQHALACWAPPDALRIKWPNDVLLHGRKVAGVLPEALFSGSACTGAVLGIGVNVHAAPTLPEAPAQPISLADAAAQPAAIDRAEVLAELLVQLRRLYRYLPPRPEDDTLYTAWAAALDTLDRQVTATTPSGTVSGRAAAVDAEGALWVHTADGRRVRLLAGEVTLSDHG
jgi:BirA family biotin operon repressor/biotin-[acetyl-CoA-carboxylase] ligase